MIDIETTRITLVKLGGSVITNKDKDKPEPCIDKINQLSQEITEAYRDSSDLLVIAHGGGSFSHPVSAKYRTYEGLIYSESFRGMVESNQAGAKLNAIVMKSLIKANLLAVTLSPNAVITMCDRQVDRVFIKPFTNLLYHGLTPVVYGDTVTDSVRGCTDVSGETILNSVALRFQEAGVVVNKVIQVSKTGGVYNNRGDIIEVIDETNFGKVGDYLKGSETTDVTGGMDHKVRAAIDLANRGIPTQIISSEPGNLKRALLSQPAKGTWILSDGIVD